MDGHDHLYGLLILFIFLDRLYVSTRVCNKNENDDNGAQISLLLLYVYKNLDEQLWVLLMSYIVDLFFFHVIKEIPGQFWKLSSGK